MASSGRPPQPRIDLWSRGPGQRTLTAMSTPDEPAGDARENLEGRYTEADGEGPHERTVHGQYTETEGDPGPDPSVEGSYTDSDEPAEAPEGDYTSEEKREP